MNKEEQSIIRKMIWINTTMLWTLLWAVVVLVMFVLIPEFEYRLLIFLVVSPIFYVRWRLWSKEIKDLI